MAESLSYNDVIEKQRIEKKDTIAKTQKMKHSTPKGDKKKKKEVTAEIEQILADLTMKHDKELKEFEVEYPSMLSENASENLDTESLKLTENTLLLTFSSGKTELLFDSESSTPPSGRKRSKAQKRREKKAQLVTEREKAIAEQEMLNLSGSRFLESSEMAKKLAERQLAIYEVPSDGDCLYKAIEHQLSILNLEKMTVKYLRELTSKYLLSHQEEYIPFLTDPITGDVLTDEKYVQYCEDIMNTASWGGHVEIQVLSKICGKPIEVIQAQGPSVIAGDETISPKLTISYHRHAFGLGEHYNSVIHSHT